MSPAPRTTVVTGGTGALGSALVATFLAAGDRVVVPWIVAAERAATAARFAEAVAKARLVLLEADVAEPEGARELARRAGAAGLLVNGVGGFAGGAPVVETGLDTWDRLYRINLRSAVAASRALLPAMLERGRGAIVNVASRAAFERPAGLAAYAASKAAVVVLTEALQKEVGPRGIRVNAVAPGTLDTPANRAAMPDADFSSWTAPEQVARVIQWLGGDAAAAVRGATLPV